MILPWIAQRHALASHHRNGQEREAVYEEVMQKFAKIGLVKDKIHKRGVQHSDLLAPDCSTMEIYPVSTEPEGKTTQERFAYFDREASLIFEAFYPEQAPLPPHLIHVTCTGYVAPSPAQKLVSKRGGHLDTTVTHAYHMGCYGAISAIRIGGGLLSSPLQ